MSDSSTQSGSGIPSMVTMCKNATDLVWWMVKQALWQKKKVTALSKKSLGNLQNMCTVQSAFLKNAHFHHLIFPLQLYYEQEYFASVGQSEKLVSFNSVHMCMQ